MSLKAHYYSPSGRSLEDCFYLGQQNSREHEDQSWDTRTWVISHQKTKKGFLNEKILFGTSDSLTGLWYSEKGCLFVSRQNSAAILYHPKPALGSCGLFEETEFRDAMLHGVWGLHQKCVFTWGVKHNGAPSLYKYDGMSWQKAEAPGFEIRAIHGFSEDCICAVGLDGGMAIWNGSNWCKADTSSHENLNAVFVAGRNEFFAAGISGSLFYGDRGKMTIIAGLNIPGEPLLGVAKWNGRVWVAAGRHGLYTLNPQANQLDIYSADYKATGFDSRHNLIISCENIIVDMSKEQENICGPGVLSNTLQ